MAVITTARARTQRAGEFANALASVRVERLEPSEAARIIFERYIDGEVTSPELRHAIGMLLDREFGPVRSSRRPEVESWQ